MAGFAGPALVVDAGSGLTRAGLAGGDLPSQVFASSVGSDQHPVVRGLVSVGTLILSATQLCAKKRERDCACVCVRVISGTQWSAVPRARTHVAAFSDW